MFGLRLTAVQVKFILTEHSLNGAEGGRGLDDPTPSPESLERDILTRILSA